MKKAMKFAVGTLALGTVLALASVKNFGDDPKPPACAPNCQVNLK